MTVVRDPARKRALVLQFGQVMQVKEEPGLGFKIPLVQDVVLYEDRILGLQTQPIEVTLLRRQPPRSRQPRLKRRPAPLSRRLVR